jgi:hypothetical protein
VKYLKETTVWEKVDVNIPAHTYIVEGMKLHGYIKDGTTEAIMFNTPVQFDKRYRTFREVKP